MKTIEIVGIVMLVGLTGGIAFQSGQYYQFYKIKPTTIENACAHYDPTTGEYTWGAFVNPVVAGDDAGSDLENAVKPAKSKHPTPPRGGKPSLPLARGQ